MGALDCIKLSVIKKFLRDKGFREVRQKGSHLIFEKPNINRPIVIATHKKEVYFYNIKELMKLLNMSRDELIKELKNY